MSLSTPELYPDLEAVLKAAVDGGIVGVFTCLPGYIVSFDDAKVTCSAQIGIRGQQLAPDGSVSLVTLKPLVDVPVRFPGGGGCNLTFPVKPNDECLLIFACRSIDAWWQSGGIQAPSDARTHDLSDAFAFVGKLSQANKLTGVSTSKAQLRSDDGSTYVELDPAGQIVNVVAPGGINLNGVTIDSSGNVNVPGTFTAVSTTTGDGIVLETHTHSGVQTGSGDTGPPV